MVKGQCMGVGSETQSVHQGHMMNHGHCSQMCRSDKMFHLRHSCRQGRTHSSLSVLDPASLSAYMQQDAVNSHSALSAQNSIGFLGPASTLLSHLPICHCPVMHESCPAKHRTTQMLSTLEHTMNTTCHASAAANFAFMLSLTTVKGQSCAL